MDYNTIKITSLQAEKILFKLYKVKGKASTLPGYVDFNFRIKIENEEGYILKVSRPDENKKYLDFQQNLLQNILVVKLPNKQLKDHAEVLKLEIPGLSS